MSATINEESDLITASNFQEEYLRHIEVPFTTTLAFDEHRVDLINQFIGQLESSMTFGENWIFYSRTEENPDIVMIKSKKFGLISIMAIDKEWLNVYYEKAEKSYANHFMIVTEQLLKEL